MNINYTYSFSIKIYTLFKNFIDNQSYILSFVVKI